VYPAALKSFVVPFVVEKCVSCCFEKFRCSSCGWEVCILLLWKVSSRLMSISFYSFVWGSNFASIQKNGESHCIIYFWRFLDPGWF